MKRSPYKERDYAFGQMMLTLRTSLHLTQAELAEQLGVTRRAVAEWEAGSSYPKAERLQAFIALGVQQQAFPAGREAQEIRALWKAAHLKVLLDEQWLQGVLGHRRPSLTQVPPRPVEQTHPAERATSRQALGPRVDWGDALTVSNFYGREEERAALEQWVVQERCRVVSVLGMGGIGKSALTAKVMQQVAPHFQVVLWRSLRDAPSCEALLEECLQVLAPEPLATVPVGLEGRLRLLLDFLREQRALLVLDNLELVMEEGERSGRMRVGFEGYARLLRQVAQTRHQSCLVLTSREKPGELVSLEGRQMPVRSLRLSGLELEACEQLFDERELLGSAPERAQLIAGYGGNPLALKIVAQTIDDLFAGEIDLFLEQNTIAFSSITELLAEQFTRLSLLEQTMVLWLAVLREPVTIEQLLGALGTPPPRMQALEALEALRRRSLVEQGQQPGSFTLQSVVLEYATTQLIGEVADEIEQGSLSPRSRLIEHGLELATAKEYVRLAQTRLLVIPLRDLLRSRYRGREEVDQHLLTLLSQVRELADYAQGYGPTNLLALLREQRGHLRSLDLSRLSLRGAYLQGVEMQDTTLTGATLREVAWTSAFDEILSVAVSTDGRYIAAGSGNGQVRVWREEGLVAYLTIQGHSDRVQAIAYSPDGRALATASWDGSVKLWDLESGAAIWTARDDSVPVVSIAISPGGKLFSGSYNGAIHMWNLHTGKHLSRLPTQSERILTLACSPDGRLLASGGMDAVIRLWDTEQGTLLRELPGHSDWVCALAFAPGADASLIASGSVDQAVKVWDAQTGTCLRTLEGHTNTVIGLAWSPDGHDGHDAHDAPTLASASHDTTIRLWDSQSWQCRNILQGHHGGVMSVDFLPGGDRLLSGSVDRTIRTWDVQSGQNVRTMQGYAFALYALAWSPDGHFLLSGSSEATITRWNMTSRTPVQVLRGHSQHVYAVAWSRAGNRIASGSTDQTVRLWDAQTGACTHILQGHTKMVYCVDWSPDGRFLASGSNDGSVRIWEMQQDTNRIGSEHAVPIDDVVWSPDGTLIASGGEDGLVLVWRATDSELVRRFEHAGVVGALCWSPNGEQLVSGSSAGEQGVLSIWDVRRGSLVRKLEGHRGFIWGLDWAAEQDVLVSAGADGTVRWWNPQQGVQLATVRAHEAWARAVRISPDGQTVASCGEDGLIQLWDMHSHQHLATLRADRPYERLDISKTSGLTNAQKAALQALGALEAD